MCQLNGEIIDKKKNNKLQKLKKCLIVCSMFTGTGQEAVNSPEL